MIILLNYSTSTVRNIPYNEEIGISQKKVNTYTNHLLIIISKSQPFRNNR